MEREIETTAPEETEALGRALGATAQGGELLGLVGELGAGKTCLVRGLAAGVGADPEQVHSPTFITATEYRGGRLPLHHIDLYRLEGALGDALFLREVLYGDGVAAVEWFERLLPAAGDEYLLVSLRYGAGDHRSIHLTAHGSRHQRWLDAALRI
ncbi:MAG TPA: tRNA (adenosine(37)-N6)-threonylcarbamoyltransferase complex ATPase subunit type 1 TsaE [Candidatus Binatia bacterium]|jgi:tRNA threonylcarbamoyladenosine biosynthesis protein TsaE|nr:tRNA (adenosine(37)-N6)-threonylcarbamoyltransferase complex ATPase subunit type 1 TsaE [Candidatus Binatia bacterium]